MGPLRLIIYMVADSLAQFLKRLARPIREYIAQLLARMAKLIRPMARAAVAAAAAQEVHRRAGLNSRIARQALGTWFVQLAMLLSGGRILRAAVQPFRHAELVDEEALKVCKSNVVIFKKDSTCFNQML